MSSASPRSPPRQPQAPAAAILFARPLPRRREKGRSRLQEPANQKAAGAAVHAGSCSPAAVAPPRGLQFLIIPLILSYFYSF